MDLDINDDDNDHGTLSERRLSLTNHSKKKSSNNRHPSIDNDDEDPTTANTSDIIQMSDRTRKNYNGSSWRRICSKPNCTHYSQSQGLCKPHLVALKKRQNSKNDPSVTEGEKPKKGDIITLSDGIRKKFDGRRYRRVCAQSDCTIVVQGSLEYQNGLCSNHYHEYRAKLIDQPTVIQSSRQRRQIPSNNQTRPSVPKPNRRLSIAIIPESVDIEHPNKGDIIEMANGSHKKFDGVIWRTICSIDGCLIAAQRNELCRKHFIQLNDKLDTKSSIHSGQRISSLSSNEDKSIEMKNHESYLSSSDDEQIDHSTSQNKFPTTVLKKWLRQHRTNPYPSTQEKLELAKQSSITYDQVNNWFNHARAILRRRHSIDDIYCRSIGVQCNLPTADQGTMSSMITDEEIANDRTIRVLIPSIKLSTQVKHEDIVVNEKERPMTITSTCLDDEQMSRVKDFCSKFQIEYSNTVDEHTTHLITDEEDGETLVCPLSKKVIQAVAHHIYILTYRWIDDCLKLNQIINEKSYEIQGDLTLSSDHHGMQRSRQSVLPLYLPRYRLLENYSIILKCNGCQNMMTNEELIELIHLSGAQYTTDSHFSRFKNDIVRIVLCEKEYLIHRHDMYEKCFQDGIHFLTPEWFLETLVQYRIQPFQEYQLSL